MSIASRIEAIEQHLTDDYNVLEVAGADLTNVDKNILNLKSTWQERLLYFINNGTDVVWNNWDKVTGEGTILTLNNTEEAPMKINLKGNTSQEGTPTPETPQDIHVVSGDNSIKVEGKNLLKLDFTTEQTKVGGLDFAYTNSSFTLKGTTNSTYKIMRLAYVPSIKKGETYIFSRNTTGISPRMQITLTFYSASGGLGNIKLTPTNNETTFTPNFSIEEVDHVNFVIEALNNNTAYDCYVELQLEKGTEKTTWEEYKGASYPIKLPEGMFLGWIPNTDYRDIIFQAKTGDTYYDSLDSTTKESLTYGKWYLNKQIGKVVLNGSENWQHYSVAQGHLFRNIDAIIDNKNINTIVPLSNYYKGIPYSQQSNRTNGDFYLGMDNTLDILNNDITTATDFKTWLSTHNTIVYYVLNTPTYAEITDSTLISQLNALAKSYASQTNISQENNDLASILNATALKEMA